MSTRRTSCTVCGLSRAAAARGECNIPIPRPQVAECLMVTLEDEMLTRTAKLRDGGHSPEDTFIGDTRRTTDTPEIDRKALMHALWDGIADRFDPDMESADEHWDWYHDSVEKPVAALLCHVYGHEPVQDHCGKPEHDHCVWCRTLMPGDASRKQPEGDAS